MTTSKARLLEKLLRNRGIAGGPVAIEAVDRTARRRVVDGVEVFAFPASFAQELYWLNEQREPGNPFYNVALRATIHGELDRTALERAIDAVVARHEILRATFGFEDGTVLQLVHPKVKVGLRFDDLSSRDELERDLAVDAIARAEATESFDLERGPLVRARLLRIAGHLNVVLFTAHHVVLDGGSIQLLAQETMSFYAAFVEGTQPTLAPLAVQYSDYAVWLRETRGDAIRQSLAYWKRQLERAPREVPLYDGARRADGDGYECESAVLNLRPSVVSALDGVARRERTTLFALLLAALDIVLWRWSGQRDLVVGTVHANRQWTEIQRLIGNFVNFLALRVRVDPEAKVSELHASVRTMLAEAQEHMHAPFEQVAAAASASESGSLYNVAFLLQSHEESASPVLKIGGVHVDLTSREPTSGGSGMAATLDLRIVAAPSPEGLKLTCEYRPRTFTSATIERLLRHVQHVLDEFVGRGGEIRVREIELLSDDERRRSIRSWNATETDFGAFVPTHRLFEAQAHRTPDAVALVFDGATMTYTDLDARAERVAASLTAAGAGADETIAIFLERSFAMVVALLGVMKAGAAYVPIDPDYPADRIAFMLDDAGAKVLLTDARLQVRVDEARGSCGVLLLDAEGAVVAPTAPACRPRDVAPSSLAYVIYTSGSTGRPKGAMNTHEGLRNRLLWMQAAFGLTETDVVLQKTPFSFDVSVWEFFWPLITGARLVLARPGGQRDSEYLAELVEREGVTTIHFVPSMLQIFVDQGSPAACRSLRRVICSGEALPLGLVRRFHDRFDADIVNLYGPTEAAIDVSCWECPRAGEETGVPIGAPIANTRLYVLAPDMTLTPAGALGELHIGGVQLARGYWQRPALTAERFIPDPFSSGRGERLYRTGDLVRQRLDGTLEYVGRTDSQIKIRGFRVELGEIESVVSAHQAVEKCAVVLRELAPNDHRIVAYVVLASWLGAFQPIDDIRQHALTVLPDYMVPSIFVVLEDLPLSPSGKLDRAALPPPGTEVEAATGAASETTAPRSPTEQLLAQIWLELLRVPRVGREDSFLALGGHSLLAVQALLEVKKAFGVSLPLPVLFDAPSLGAFAHAIDRALREGDASQTAEEPIRPAQREGPLLPSLGQETLWFADQLAPGSAAYNVVAALRLRGRLDLASLRSSVAEVVRRHEALRTTFVAVDGRPRVVVHEEIDENFTVVETSSAAGNKEAFIQREVDASTDRPFDLTKGPLLRVTVLAIDASEHIVVFVAHHIIVDGWSFAPLVREIASFYKGLVSGQPPTLPELPVQFTDFAQWQRDLLRSGRLDDDLAYWTDRLAGAPAAVEWPTARAGDFPERRTARRTFELSPARAAAISGLAKRERVTPFMVLLAAFTTLLHRYTGQDDLVIGTPVANRSRRELEELIGFFVNMLPLRTTLSAESTLGETLKHVREVSLGAWAHQDLPFEKLLETVAPARAAGRRPLYQVFFALQNMEIPALDLPGLTVEPVDVEKTEGPDELALTVSEANDGFVAVFEYRRDLFTPATVDAFVSAYSTILDRMTEDLGARLSALDLRELGSPRAGTSAPVRVAVSSTFTAEPLADVLSFWSDEIGLPLRVDFAPYHQVFQQLSSPESILARNRDGLNVVLLRFEDWTPEDASGGREGGPGWWSGVVDRLEQDIRDVVDLMLTTAQRSSTVLAVYLCPPSAIMSAAPERAAFFARMDAFVREKLTGVRGIRLVTGSELEARYSVIERDDPRSESIGRIPYRLEFYAALGTDIARTVHALQKPPSKVIVLDCDNTLWTGVCAEDGCDGIVIDEGRTALQRFLLAQRDAGVLLCLCSKNEEDDVATVFARRSDMPLQREHVAAWRINWQPKSENLKALASELSLGLDSFAFIDDSAVECAEVRASCPEVTVLQLPDDSARIASWLEHMWLFDVMSTTEEDRARARFYQQNAARSRLERESPSLADFLASLELRIEVRDAVDRDLPRVAQLTQRTNQFNTTCLRQSEAELRARLEARSNGCLVVNVRDRFGDYGLVGVVLHALADDALRVDALLLSCRVLGRGVEHQVLARLGELAASRAARAIVVPFRKTARNAPAFDFLESVAGEFRREPSEGIEYAIPVAIAQATKYTPGAVEPTASPREPEERSEGTKRWRVRGDVLERIAADLRAAGGILDAIAARRRRGRTASTAFVAPRTPMEDQIARIWSEVLAIDEIGVEDDFFDLGGHSLIATQILSRLHAAFETEVSLRELFEARTVARLASMLESAALENAGDDALAEALQDLEGLSDAEVRAMLAEDAGDEDDD